MLIKFSFDKCCNTKSKPLIYLIPQKPNSNFMQNPNLTLNLTKLTKEELKILVKYELIDFLETKYLTKENEENPKIFSSEKLELKKQIENKIQELQKQKADLDKTKTDFETFYPTQIMTSAWEIFYAWIIRMIMTGKYFTGQIPFEKYFCHAWVLDEKGRKMSKSLGNVVDPSSEIAKYSSDAVRLSLLAGTIAGKNLRYQGKNAEKYRNFITKIVNVAKFFEYQESLTIT